MKKNIIKTFITAVCCMAMLASCSDDNLPARTPVVDESTVNISSKSLTINESMEIHFTGVADQVVIFTGDKGHSYDKLESDADDGFVINKGLFTYSYNVPGTFHVVIIASTYDSYMGNNLKRAKYEFDVTVADNTTTIDQIYSQITPNVYYARLAKDDAWVMSLPTKQVYNGMDRAINASKLRLSLDIASDSSQVYVDGVKYSDRTYYDLTKIHDIKVVANSGDTRLYKLYTLIFPEFSTISAGGKPGALTRNAYEQDMLTYHFDGLSDADFANTTLEFTTEDNVTLLVNGNEVKSGTTVNLSSTDSSYILRRRLAEDREIYTDTRIKFTNKQQ